MRGRHTVIAISIALGSTIVPMAAGAQLSPGARLPNFHARDLAGQMHQSAEALGHPTLVVALTDPDAGLALHTWLETTTQHFGTRVGYISLIAVDVPGLVPTSMARHFARNQVPQEHWNRTWLDRSGRVRQALQLDESKEPYVFVVDSNGRIVASVHGALDAETSRAVWGALGHANSARGGGPMIRRGSAH